MKDICLLQEYTTIFHTCSLEKQSHRTWLKISFSTNKQTDKQTTSQHQMKSSKHPSGSCLTFCNHNIPRFFMDRKKVPLTILGSNGKLPLLVAGGNGVGDGSVGANVQTGGPHPCHHRGHLGCFADGGIVTGSLKRGRVVVDVEDHHPQHGCGRQLGGNLKPKATFRSLGLLSLC